AYLQIPYELDSRIKELTDFVIGGSNTDYDKISAIRSYLRENYQYEINHPKPGPGTDPVEFFLFTSKEGICTHFNSALVLMLRSAGIPSRMVVGFMIDPTTVYQNVTAAEAHAYAEVKLDGLGWITVDALGWWDDLDRAVMAIPDLKISGKVFQDDNMNGVDDDDHPLEYQEVSLTDLMQNTSLIATTDQTGRYSFAVWPGEYEVAQDMGEGWVNTTPSTIRLKLVDKSPKEIDFGAYPINQVPTKSTVTNVTSIASRTALMSRFNVVGTVTDDHGTPLTGMSVRIYITKDKVSGARIYCGKAWLRDGSFNASCLMPNVELGSYQVVAQCAGNQEYGPSWSDPTIQVVDDIWISIYRPSGLTVAPPGQMLYFQISVFGKYRGASVRSSWINVSTNESGYNSNEPVRIDETGIGYYSLTRSLPCDLTVKVTFDGTEELISASSLFAVHFGYVQLSISTTKLVRGEANVLSGKASVRGVALSGMPVFCSSNGLLGAMAQTDSKGAFAAPLLIPIERSLGTTIIEVSVGEFGSEMVQENIVSRTLLTTSVVNNRLSAMLVDDNGLPLARMPIRLSSSAGNLTAITDKNGVADFAPPSSKSENLTFIFLGTDEYLPSQARMLYSPTPFVNHAWSAIALVLVSAFAVLAYYYQASGRRIRLPKMKAKPVRSPPKKVGPYLLEFPQIPAGLPPVWHQSEELLLRVRGREGLLQLSIDGMKQGAIKLVDGTAVLPLQLPLGRHQLIVAGKEGKTEETVKVTLYGEEIAHLYSDTLKELSLSCTTLSEDLTPREAQSKLSKCLEKSKGGALELMTSLFERAEFGPEAMGRSDYEKMFAAVKEVKG
ncbi:MAG TPA: transglutaminase domain-containing protein, partial [Methanomassiliicoccales archaeon]|nr:transglutaminase domain-containing protein [Methanomassiliicoccales archaeon]